MQQILLATVSYPPPPRVQTTGRNCREEKSSFFRPINAFRHSSHTSRLYSYDTMYLVVFIIMFGLFTSYPPFGTEKNTQFLSSVCPKLGCSPQGLSSSPRRCSFVLCPYWRMASETDRNSYTSEITAGQQQPVCSLYTGGVLLPSWMFPVVFSCE